MKKMLMIGLLCLATAQTQAAARAKQTPQEPPAVRMDEGFFLDGIEGTLETNPQRSGEWIFRPSQKIALIKRDLPAGQPLPMLPCGVLEQMAQMAAGQSLHIRLWAMATLYKHDNYLYAVYFLPLKDGAAPQPAQPTEPAQPAPTPTPAQEQEEDSVIPMEILKQIKANTPPDLQKFQQVAQVTGDTNLIGRAGYLQDEGSEKIFVPDGFGQNIDLRRFVLLPGAAMENAEKEMNRTPGRQRYTVSGLVTTYSGTRYILLRSAQRTYTHGNFTQ